ncbi:uncharacterized protein [Parasteatoda tepidariorum]|uniref:uncharacterized protein n=1 Tax=Parasteatoda tepidariorum TaxID=114398 RepID=UPI00077FB52F|nr:uncharacterized protein LOC107440747 [Parasteatoda tepidariorum]
MNAEGSTPPQSPNFEVPFSDEIFRPRTISDVVSRIKKDNVKNSVRSFSYDPKSNEDLAKLGKDLRQIAVDFSNESKKHVDGEKSAKTKRILQDLIPLVNERYGIFLKRVEDWKELRVPLIEKLDNYIKKLDRNFKWSTFVRLIASTADATGSVGGLLLHPDSSWAKYAFNAASVCGLCGLISTVWEVASSKQLLDEICDSREEDYKLFESVVRWFEENKDLDFAVQDMFPYGIDKDVALQVQEASKELEEYIKVFESALVSNVKKDAELLENKDFLYSLQLFSRSHVASLWWNRIIFRKHPIQLDMNRMTLQMEFGQMQSLVLQSIPALPLEQQRLTSLPVAGRIMLNCLTMYDSWTYIKQGSKSMHSDKLRKLLNVMKREMEIIDDVVEKMKPVDFS